MDNACNARRPPTLHSPFTPQDVEAVIRGARRVLAEIGVRCADDALRRRLASPRGVRQSGERLFYDDAAVDGVLGEMRGVTAGEPEEESETKWEPFGFGGPWSCLLLADAAVGVVRQASAADAGRMVRLLEGLGAVVGVTPVVPAANVPPAMRNLAGLKTVLVHSARSRSMTNQPTPAEMPFVREMGAAAGRIPSAFVMVLISPLRFEERALQYYLKYRDEPGMNLSLSGGIMPCTGSTSPMHLPGTLIQAVAENIALAACFQALGLPCPGLNLRCDPFDMRFGTYVIGSPEYHLLDMGCRAIYRAVHGSPRRSGSFRSMAKQPDAQAMAERSFSVLLQALQGARQFSNAGQMSMDEVFSPEQAVLDREILRNVERIAAGQVWREEAPGRLAVDEAFDIIRRGVGAGQYLEQDETLAGYKDFYYSSDLFTYENAGSWQQRGSLSALARASSCVAQVLAAAEPCERDDDRARAIEAVYQVARKRLK